MKTQILNMYPDFTNEEVQSVIDEYNQTDIEVCQSCREEINSDNLISELAWSGDWDSPSEYISICPHCREKEPILEAPTIEEFLHITA